ncbi:MULTISPECIES: hypothetical protein [unclassified Methanosarcina]|nr:MULTISPECIES: hypothetical protein [unclassified Methanosarcina]
MWEFSKQEKYSKGGFWKKDPEKKYSGKKSGKKYSGKKYPEKGNFEKHVI